MYAKINSAGEVIQYPYTQADFKLENPNTKLSTYELNTAYFGTEDAEENGSSVVQVVEVQKPSITNLQNVEEGDPELSGDVWSQTWVVSDKTSEEIEEIQARITQEALKVNTDIRNRRLSKSDWTQLVDAPLTDDQKADYAAWRQEMRDLTSHASWPNLEEADWPLDPHNMLNISIAD